MEREFPYIEIVPDGTEKETSENTNMTGNVHAKFCLFHQWSAGFVVIILCLNKLHVVSD